MSLYSLGKFFCFVFCKLFLKVSVVGIHNINNERGGLVLVSNHTSYFDPVLLGLHSKRQLFFMAKKELFSVPVFGAIIKRLGAFPVDRRAHDTAALDFAKNLVSSGEAIAIFPEGTRSKTSEISKFKLGAIKIAVARGCKILPCSIFYAKGKFRRRAFLKYGEAVSLQQLCGREQLGDLTRENLISLSSNLRELVLEMNNAQKKLFLQNQGLQHD